MYNRYIPQPDGTYRRNRVPDRPCPPPGPKPAESICEPVCREEAETCAESCPSQPQPVFRPQPKHEHRPCRKDSSIDGFLRNLLPKDFDTGDLLIVVLLLLMAGECGEDQNQALLTLLLYFFM